MVVAPACSGWYDSGPSRSKSIKIAPEEMKIPVPDELDGLVVKEQGMWGERFCQVPRCSSFCQTKSY